MKGKADLVKLGATYEKLFSSTDGKKVLEDLDRHFGGTTLKKSKDGTIDQTASIAAAGCREVLLYIELMRKHNAITAGNS